MNCPTFGTREILGVLAYAAFEFWIGKTKRTRANSFIELTSILILVGLAFIANLGRKAWKLSKGSPNSKKS